MPKKKKQVTITDLAARTGYSIATVSRALNHKGSVGKIARERIDQAVHELGYRLNHDTRPSVSTTIGVLIPNLANPFNSTVLDGISKSAEAHKLSVVLIIASENQTSADYYFDLLKDMNLRGLIALSAFPDNITARKVNQELPVVMCSEYLEQTDISYVGIDDRRAAYQATKYLLSIGRTKLAMVNSTPNHKYAREREAGYKQAIRDANLQCDEHSILHVHDINFSLALSKITNLLEVKKDIDGVFNCSDVFAFATLEAAKRVGKKVPKDLSVIGFDNIFLSTVVSPSLTTVKQPSYEIGYEACEILVEKMTRKNAPDRHEVLDTSLLLRDST